MVKRFAVDPANPALAWQEAEDYVWFVGCEEWGALRFSRLINGEIPAQQLTLSGSVCCYLSEKTEPHGGLTIQWIVSWRENGRNKTRCFGRRRYGSITEAAHQANLFTAKKRAERTSSVLNLPNFTFDLSDLHAHFQD